jgi:hypothetical protein
MVGVRPALRPGRRGCPDAILSQPLPDTSVVAVWTAVQFRTPADGLLRPVPPGGYYGNRSPGWRPLVGCNQRR